MGKLVRDRIPEIIRADGREVTTRTLSDVEYLTGLLDKLDEEARELREATALNRLEEAADVYEVLLALLALQGHEQADLLSAAETKRAERGGFSARVWLDQ